MSERETHDSGAEVPAAEAADAAAESTQTSSDSHHPQSDMSPLERLLMKREREMKQCIHLLQGELERRSNEAVVSAAKFRNVVSQLADLNPSGTTEFQSSQQQQPEDEIRYKGEFFHSELFSASLGIVHDVGLRQHRST